MIYKKKDYRARWHDAVAAEVYRLLNNNPKMTTAEARKLAYAKFSPKRRGRKRNRKK